MPEVLSLRWLPGALRPAAVHAVLGLAVVLASLPAAAQPCDTTVTANGFERVPIVTGLTLPMTFQEAPGGRYFFIERAGAVKIYDGSTTHLAGVLPVDNDAEFGLLGMALDPGFASNNWIYLYYTVKSDAVTWQGRLSRFTMSGNTLQLATERLLLTIPHIKNYHVAGDLEFGPDGNLYLSTGANDFAFNPLYSGCDFGNAGSNCARASSGNKNDLRGKLLRIRPTASGSPTYTIPAGNLFAGSGTERPEIYAMGNRNPFRYSIDSATGTVYFAEVGTRYEELNRITSAGNYGWPYYEGPNNYHSPDTSLPAQRSPWLWYHQDSQTSNVPIPGLFAQGVPAGRSIMAGPVYHFRSGNPNPRKLPATHDGDLFFWDFSKGLTYGVDMAADGTILNVYEFLTGLGFGPAANSEGQNGIIDMKVASDDTLLVLEYWSGTLYRINYVGSGNRTPVIIAGASASSGNAPLSVLFNSTGTFDPDGHPLSFAWDFDGNGTADSTAPGVVSYTYSAVGGYTARLTVTDSLGAQATREFPIVAGNNAPLVSFLSPPEGGFFEWGDRVSFGIRVTDAEDGSTDSGTIPCSRVLAETALGHDGHDHGDVQVNACSGVFALSGGADHPEDSDLYYVLSASHDDTAQGAAPSLTGTTQLRLHPRRKEAEHATRHSGTTLAPNTDVWTGGARVVTGIDSGDYMVLEKRNLQGMTSVSYRVASGGAGGRIELRLDGVGGTLLSNVSVPATGGFENWVTVIGGLPATSGVRDLYFVFRGSPITTDLFDLNWVEFQGSGVGTDLTAPTLARVSTGRDSRRVSVRFSEPVTETTAEAATSYTVSGESVLSAELQPDGKTVYLTTSVLDAGTLYTLGVSGVRDMAGLAVASATSATFRFHGHDVPDGLAGLWRFDEGTGTLASDASGNGRTGALRGGAGWAPGALGTGVQLDGVDDDVDIPDLSFSGDFSFTAWVRLSGTIDNTDALVGQGGPGQDINFYAQRLRLFGPGDVVVATRPVSPDRWVHAAIVRAGGNVTLYLDGREDARGTWTGTFTPRVLGRGNAGTLGGRMDDVRLYGRALTAAEVGTLAANEPPAPSAHWKLDDGAGLQARDSGPQAQTGLLRGGPTWENGMRGGALQLDGVNDAVDIPDLSFPGDFTVAGWVRLTGTVDNRDSLVGQDGPGQDVNFFDRRLRLWTGSSNAVVATRQVRPDVWVHCAITRSGSQLTLYLDGVRDATGAWSGVFTPRMLGRGNMGYLGGAMDDVRLYAASLSDAQVEALARRTGPGLVAHWTLDDGAGAVAVDAAGNGYDAALVGVGAWTQQGRSRGALSLNGTGEWLNPANLGLPGDFTVAAWVRPSGTVDNQDAIVGQEGAGPDLNFFNQRLRLFTNDPNVWDAIEASAAVTPGAWTHYAVTREAGRLRLYVNGVQDTGVRATACWAPALPIQAVARGASGTFGGTLDDVLVQDRPLRPAELRRLADDVPGGLFGHWTFDEGGGAVAADSSGNALAGSLVGGAGWATGRVGGALQLDGVDDWVNVPDLALSGDFTLVAWVNLTGTIDNADALVGQEGPGGPDVNFYAQRLRLWTGTSDVLVASTPAAAGVWTQYAIVRSGSTLRLYVNGVEDATGSWTGTLIVRSIGRGNVGTFGGLLDDVRLYTRALSPAEL